MEIVEEGVVKIQNPMVFRDEDHFKGWANKFGIPSWSETICLSTESFRLRLFCRKNKETKQILCQVLPLEKGIVCSEEISSAVLERLGRLVYATIHYSEAFYIELVFDQQNIYVVDCKQLH